MILRRFGRSRRGATAVEFAIIAPLYIALLFGLVEGGMALSAQLALEHAVVNAARCSALNTTTCGTAAETQTYAAGEALGQSVPTTAFTVTSPACGANVAASYVYNLPTLVFGTASMTLTATACYPK
jgi:Flp pilus assembly protein TadG